MTAFFQLFGHRTGNHAKEVFLFTLLLCLFPEEGAKARENAAKNQKHPSVCYEGCVWVLIVCVFRDQLNLGGETSADTSTEVKFSHEPRRVQKS